MGTYGDVVLDRRTGKLAKAIIPAILRCRLENWIACLITFNDQFEGGLLEASCGARREHDDVKVWWHAARKELLRLDVVSELPDGKGLVLS